MVFEAVFTNCCRVLFLLIVLYKFTHNLLVEIDCIYHLFYTLCLHPLSPRNQEDQSVLGTWNHIFPQSEHRTMKEVRNVPCVLKS